MIATLQEASVKDCIGYAGMLSATRFACRASFLNLSIWKWERELARLLWTPRACTIHALILW